MGMFDYVKSSYDLGPHFTNVVCHTKDIEEDIGGTMSQYWLDPAGYLYLIDYNNTVDLKIYEPGDPDYDEERAWLNIEWVRNGNRGAVRMHPITKYVEVRPEEWEGPWEKWPRCTIHFKRGRLIDYETNLTEA